MQISVPFVKFRKSLSKEKYDNAIRLIKEAYEQHKNVKMVEWMMSTVDMQNYDEKSQEVLNGYLETCHPEKH